MKAITIFGYILCLCMVVLMSSGIYSLVRKIEYANGVDAMMSAREAFVIDSLVTEKNRSEALLKDSLIKDSEVKIKQRDLRIKRLLSYGKEAEERADSLQAEFEKILTVESCQDVVAAKNKVIVLKNEAIDSLNKQVVEYEDLAVLFKSKSINLENIIISHESNIKTCNDALKEVNKTIIAENKKMPRWLYGVIGFAGGAVAITLLK